MADTQIRKEFIEDLPADKVTTGVFDEARIPDLSATYGDVYKVGTPVANQVAVWSADGSIQGLTGLTYNGTALSITGNVTVSGTVDGRDVAADGTKLDFITITQAVDLDTIEARVNELDASVILQGTWDASSGSFPGSGTAQSGHSYIVSVSGTVDSVEFTANDRIVAITDNASTTTYSGNWHKLDYTDAVLSVAGKTGTVTLAADDIISGEFADTRISETSVTQHIAAIDHDSLLNFVGNEHINHTSVTLTAGDGLSGGGDISANRTFNVDINSEASVAAATGDELLIADVSDSNNIKKVTAQSIADLASASPGGSNTEIQFNDGGSFGGDSAFTWDKTNNHLTIDGIIIDTPNSTSLAITDSELSTTAANSIWIGYGAGNSSNFPIQNVALGNDAFSNITVGSSSVAVGYQAGNAVTTAGAGVFIGAFADTTAPTASDQIVIGMNATADAGNQAVIGANDSDGEINDIKLGVNTTQTNGMIRYQQSTGMTLDEYGSGTITGTATFALAVTSAGIIIEEALTSGDVVGPASVTNNRIVRFDGTTGKLIQESGISINDNDDISNVRDINFGTSTESANFIRGGNDASGDGHDVSIIAADGIDSNDDGGDILLNPGEASGSGTDGVVKIVTPDGAGEMVLDISGMSASRTVSFPNESGTINYTKTLLIKIIKNDTALSTGDNLNENRFTLPKEVDGMDLVEVGAHVFTPSTSGAPSFQIRNFTDSVDVLSTNITIDANEKDSKDATTAAVINTSNDAAAEGDEWQIDVDAAGTGTLGGEIRLTFKKP